jgi:hypothetical protein
MATEHRFDPYGNQPDAEKKPRTWLSTCLIGCLVITVVGLVLFTIVAYWVSQNWRGWVSDISDSGINELIDQSELAPQEKQEIRIEVDRVIDAFRGGRVSLEQVGMILENLAESPLLTMIMVSSADAHYFDKSGLSDEEKAEGRTTLRRFLRGAIDGSIDEDSVNTAMAHVAERQSGGGWRLRDRVTDEQLRNFLTVAKEKADEANIPLEPPEFDPSEEVKRAIDEALSEPSEIGEQAIEAEEATEDTARPPAASNLEQEGAEVAE